MKGEKGPLRENYGHKIHRRSQQEQIRPSRREKTSRKYKEEMHQNEHDTNRTRADIFYEQE